jgi:hypothetical protein
VSEPISIFDVIKRGGYEASLLTTFSSTLPFYEEVVLRKLVAAGCRHNVVLIDRAQCAKSWSSMATRPRLAGHAYSLVPMSAPGAFHPKICLLAGPKRASLLIGSHNLTIAGFGYNREMTNWVEISGKTDIPGAAVVAQAWKLITAWLQHEQDHLPQSVVDSVLATANFIAPFLEVAAEIDFSGLLGQYSGGPSLMDQLDPLVPENVRRIALIGPFFDDRLAMIDDLRSRWPAPPIVVGIDPDTVLLRAPKVVAGCRFVDASVLQGQDEHGYLHAKAIYFDAPGDHALFVSGSANPSGPAWMGSKSSGNTEAVMVRRGSEARAIAADTGVVQLFDLPSMQPGALAEVIRRSRQVEIPAEPAGERLLIGVADTGLKAINIENGASLHLDRATILGCDDRVLEEMQLPPGPPGDLAIPYDGDLDQVRSVKLARKGKLVARAMIHHSAEIAAHARSTSQHQLRAALAELGTGSADIGAAIAAVERVIFSDEAPSQINQAVQDEGVRLSGTNVPARPTSLAIHVNEIRKPCRKHKLMRSGDLAYLLDILIRRLGVGL